MKTQDFYEQKGMNNQNAMRANDRAAYANGYARLGRECREIYLSANQAINDWKSIMAGSPVFLLTLIFFISAIAEIVYSWEMYREFLGAFFGIPHWSIVLLLGLVINVGAAYVSHLISKTMSSNLFDLEVYNYQFISKRGLIQEVEAVEYILKDKRKDLIYGIISAIVLLSIVCFISWQRSFLMTDISGVDYSLVQKILPVLIVLMEILTGIYLGIYLIPLIARTIIRNREKKKTMEYITLCSKDDRLVTALLVTARENGEKYTPTKEIADSLFRINNRSSDSLNYVDEINIKQIEVNVVNSNKNPVPNIHVVGFLPSNNSITNGLTGYDGRIFLVWDSQDDYITKLQIDGNLIFEGQYRKNNTYSFLIPNNLALT